MEDRIGFYKPIAVVDAQLPLAAIVQFVDTHILLGEPRPIQIVVVSDDTTLKMMSSLMRLHTLNTAERLVYAVKKPAYPGMALIAQVDISTGEIIHHGKWDLSHELTELCPIAPSDTTPPASAQ